MDTIPFYHLNFQVFIIIALYNLDIYDKQVHSKMTLTKVYLQVYCHQYLQDYQEQNQTVHFAPSHLLCEII